MTADPAVRSRVARWLADHPLIGHPDQFWDEMGPALRARYEMAAADLLDGPLADAFADCTTTTTLGSPA